MWSHGLYQEAQVSSCCVYPCVDKEHSCCVPSHLFWAFCSMGVNREAMIPPPRERVIRAEGWEHQEA